MKLLFVAQPRQSPGTSSYATFLGHGSHCGQFWRNTYDWGDPHYWYFENIEDPNDRGYDAIRRVFLNTIIKHTSLVARLELLL